jgi:hypothetical protein
MANHARYFEGYLIRGGHWRAIDHCATDLGFLTMKIDHCEYTIAEHFAAAIINDDYSGLDDSEESNLREWLNDNEKPYSHWDIQDDDRHFARCEITGLMADCITMRQYFRN